MAVGISTVWYAWPARMPARTATFERNSYHYRLACAPPNRLLKKGKIQEAEPLRTQRALSYSRKRKI
jgi:hypothetical protein